MPVRTEKVIERLDELVMHVIDHFRDEEAVLVQCDYPDLREHQERHMMLLQKTLTLREIVARDSNGLPELMKFVIDEVIVAHLIKADRLYFTSVATRN